MTQDLLEELCGIHNELHAVWKLYCQCVYRDSPLNLTGDLIGSAYRKALEFLIERQQIVIEKIILQNHTAVKKPASQ